MLRYPFAFEAPVERLDFGRVAYNPVFVPKPVLKLLPLSQIPRLRMDAEVGGLLTSSALMASKRGRHIRLFAVRPETREQWILEVLEDILEFCPRRQSTPEPW